MLHPIEIKRTASPGTELIKPFKLLDKASVPRGKGAIICMKETLSAVDSDNYIVPIWMIKFMLYLEETKSRWYHESG